ncbi:DNA cytosine methyltransferase [Novosphingobium sp. KN65.2]|uniref:DNA cytosine methyltransferase n=1 Tax=Novosphingobium sp. KN65.2 TaxID=1478134 RepID=UPI0005E6CB23|nr:DNA cytosine methyltransferase [Novosphingobium sp. KN65.2]CDO35791.1 Site-specific DNA methylase [Novosphingobium sp. KN65.2]
MANGLIVDNFAGGGGASTGIEAALGRAVDIAINHDPEAVAMHVANHPETKHFCQSIWAVDCRDACTVDGELMKIDLAWFSPDCKHHSKAKGGKPRDKGIRDLAWVVVEWIERLQKEWERRGHDPKTAIRVIALENVEEFRKWGPLDEHGKPIKDREGEEFDLFVRRIKRRGARLEYKELIAYEYGVPTIRKRLYMVIRFDGLPIVWPEKTHGKPSTPEVENGTLKRWRTAGECLDWSIPCPSIFDRPRQLKDATMRRIAHGTMRYVVNAEKRFFVPVTNSGWNPERAWSSDEPLRTITTAKGGEFAAVEAQIVPHITKFRGGAIGSDAGHPMPTITANGNPARPAGAQPLALASATLVQTGYGERKGQAPRAVDPDAPLGTIVAGGGKHADVAAFLSQFRGSNRTGSGGDTDVPAKVITAGGQHQAVVYAHIEQANGGPRNDNLAGRSADAPLSTVTVSGSQQRIVQTTLLEEGDLPPELMEKATRVAAFLIKYYGAAQHGQSLDEPLHSVTALPRFAVVTVTIDAKTYVIVDIGMRMLTPRELARCQGFPDDYVLDPIGPSGKPLSKAAQIRMIGNSVCPGVAEAIVRANLPEFFEQRESEVQAA